MVEIYDSILVLAKMIHGIVKSLEKIEFVKFFKVQALS